MRFHPNHPVDNNRGQRVVWNLLQSALADERDAVAYYRFPIFGGRGSRRREPDVLLVHRELGIWTMEVKGCRIDNVAEIHGNEWMMRDWHSETETPVAQVDEQHWAVKGLIERERALRDLRLVFEYRVLLPFVTREQWSGKGFANHPSCRGVVLLEEDLGGSNFRSHLRDAASEGRMPALTDEQWELLLASLRGRVHDAEPRPVPTTTATTSPLRLIAEVERATRFLDVQQERIASEVPEGPQRIRGLAGTGKSVLLARRAAFMHAGEPAWEIGVCFFTRALHDHLEGMIAERFRALTGEEVNRSKLHLWHAWGGRDREGLYSRLAQHCGIKPLALDDLKERYGERAYREGFAIACDDLERALEGKTIEPFLDALLIDEGQDLPPSFYRLALRTLRPPHRLYWAYDEAQGIESLIVPTAAEVFGRDSSGRPVVDLAGAYPSGIKRAHNMSRCYRTPTPILTVGHAINMGLLRKGGPLQGVTTAGEWETLGYRVESGDFSNASVRAKRLVTVERSPWATAHPADTLGVDRSSLLVVEQSSGAASGATIVAKRARDDIAGGLTPDDLLVVVLDNSMNLARALRMHKDALEREGISAIIPGKDTRPDVFRVQGAVTVTHVFRAKGNEAWKVYASGIDINPDADTDDELRQRNRAFVALTRSRLWCVAVARGSAFEELNHARATAPRLTFPAFNQASLKRVTNSAEQGELFADAE